MFSLFLVAFFKKNETQGTQMSVRLSVRPSRRFAVSVTRHAPVCLKIVTMFSTIYHERIDRF